jgi:hypothetical protein
VLVREENTPDTTPDEESKPDGHSCTCRRCEVNN